MARTRENVRAAIYCRISKDTEDTRLGVERQEKDCQKLCADRGWTVASVYIDNDISATDPKKKRPEYDRLLRDIASGQIDAVAVWAEDRLHRRPSELESFVQTCDVAGLTNLASVGGDTDLNDPDALFMLRMKGAIAAREVATLKKRIQRKMLQKAQSGEWHGGKRPFGYKDGGIEIDMPEAALIREAAHRILEGSSLRSIARDWNERGIRTTWDKEINETGLKKTLTGARVAGLVQHQGAIIGKAKWPAILDEVTWQQVRTILQDPARRGPRASQSHPLRGVLKCGLCGTMLTASPRSEGRRYVCHSRHGCGKLTINADMVEKYVFGVVLPLVDAPDLRDIFRSEDRDAANRASALVLANSEDESKLSEIDDMFADGEIDRKTYLKQSQRLRNRIDDRNTELTGLQGNNALERLGGSIQSRWDTLSAEDKRAVVRSLVAEIKVSKVITKGRNTFDPARVLIEYRTDAITKVLIARQTEIKVEQVKDSAA
jgi:DNA invertase Pin-like site-specific DNA recombinase